MMKKNQLKKRLKFTTAKKKIVIGVLLFSMATIMIGGCSSGKTEKANSNKVESTKKKANEVDVKNFVNVSKMYVREKSKNVDFGKEATVVKGREDCIVDVKVDDSKVDLSKKGKYKVKYTIILDKQAVEKLEGEKGKDSKVEAVKAGAEAVMKEDTSKAESTDKKTAETVEVKTEVEVEVVDKETADKLASEGKEVIVDDNKVLTPEGKEEEPKKEGTTVEEAKEEHKAESNNNTQPQSQGTQQSGGTTSAPAQQSQPTQQSQPAQQTQPTQPAQPVHTHSWVQHYTTVTDYQTVTDYAEQAVPGWKCSGCGAVFESAESYGSHSMWECNDAGYSVITLRVDMVPVGSHQEPCGSHQVPDYMYCSGCGATQ